MFHITGDADGPYQVTKPSVVMQHGMGGSGIGWLTSFGMRPSKNEVPMAYQLAKDGWDVWITNNSAVTYSQEHDTWTPYDKEYWAMDWRKYALYDFPAAVAEIRKRNGDKKVAYVGHSQGTTQMLAGMGLIPEWYDENVSSAVLLGPCDCPNQ